MLVPTPTPRDAERGHKQKKDIATPPFSAEREARRPLVVTPQLVGPTSLIVLELGRQPAIISLSALKDIRLRVRVKCNEDDTIGDLKKLAAAQLGTRPEKLRIQKWYTVYKDHITLDDYEIHDGMGLELYYQ
eukprot:scaffold2510_cov169-Amphora_coffeaeformis.AAC.36